MRESIGYCPLSGKLFWLRDVSIRGRKGREAGTVTSRGYLRVKYKGENYLSHRVAFFLMEGRWPSGQLDHVDGDPSNNSWGNLREASPEENSRNRKRYSNNTSGYPGVRKAKGGRWQAGCEMEGRVYHLGYFDNPDEASEVVKKFRKDMKTGHTMRDFL